MISSLPGTPCRSTTPAPPKGSKRIALSSGRRHSFSGSGFEEALTEELTNLVRCAPRCSRATVTLVVEMGSNSPSVESSAGSQAEAPPSASSSSPESIIEHSSVSDNGLHIDFGGLQVDSDRTTTLLAESDGSLPHDDPLEKSTFSNALPTAPQYFDPYLASSYNMHATVFPYSPPAAQDLFFEYQRATSYHSRYPSLATPTSPMFPQIPSAPIHSDLNPSAAPFPSDHPSAQPFFDPNYYSPQHYPGNPGYDFIPTPPPHPHHQLYYGPPVNGLSTPPTPPDYLFPTHFPSPRRLSQESNESVHSGGSFMHAPYEQPQPVPQTDSVMDQLERGAVMRRSGTTKFFDMQKGFGFIVDDNIAELGGKDIFVHYTAILMKQGFRCLHQDEPVNYDLVKASSGGYQALNVSGPRGRPLKGLGLSDRSQAKPTEQREPRETRTPRVTGIRRPRPIQVRTGSEDSTSSAQVHPRPASEHKTLYKGPAVSHSSTSDPKLPLKRAGKNV